MFLRIDRLQIELPMPKEQDPNAAAAVQALLGGRFGEMSTLMNYMYQSFNFRGKKALKPYYDLIANIATEELGHIELVAATINSLLAKNPGKDLEEGVDLKAPPWASPRTCATPPTSSPAGPTAWSWGPWGSTGTGSTSSPAAT